MFDPATVRFRGPLTPYVHGFWAELRQQGYAPFSGGNLLRVVAHFSRWLDDHRLGLDQLSEERVASFMAHRRQQGYTQFLTPRALRPLLDYLRRIGIVIRPAGVAEGPIDRLLREYAQYLSRERCLGASTIRGYTDFVRVFAKAHFGREHSRWHELSPLDITEFVMDASRRSSIGCCKNTITRLRSLLRFLHVRGHVPRDLSGCVPAIAGWRLAWLPRGLDPDQVDGLLRQGEHRSAARCRDAAMVRLLVRLGLRAGDAAALTLDDLDWRAGEIVVRGKGRRQSRLPLPHDVGRAIAAYLRRRPRGATRKVFLRSRAPYHGLSPGGVVSAVRGALRRAGVTSGGAHLLRHTAATQMLRKGASLSEIAHVLRHRHIDTTAIYAKVDLSSLTSLVQPWPESAR
jgi:integrase/recombinase XerD